MGSGTSRGKRVAPASVGSEASVGQAAAPKPDNRPFKPLGVHAALRNARNSARGGAPPPERRGEGHESDLSEREGDDVDGELDTVVADGEEPVAKSRRPKKAVVRSKTYGLCHFSQEEEDDEEDSSPRETRGSDGGSSRVVNRRSNGALKHASASSAQHSSSSRGFLTGGSLMEAVPTTEKQQTFGQCHNSSVTTPVILYDGSEEELMDTIEREFS